MTKIDSQNLSIKRLITTILLAVIASASGCKSHKLWLPWNVPHPKDDPHITTVYSAFAERPKTLDPAKAYTQSESIFIDQIYEAPLQYHYLKRPYQLEPLTATHMPIVTFLDKQHHPIKPGQTKTPVAYSIYDIYIKPRIYYQPHPAFAKNHSGQYRYHQLSTDFLKSIHKLSDFKYTGTRELTAADYVYEIKRLAVPDVNSPILSLMNKHILGLSNYMKTLKKAKEANPHKRYLDLRRYPLEGAKVISRYHYQIIMKGQYPQFIYWLAMSFFAPMPWEADAFYNQPGLASKNISLDWFPIGTGPYYLTVNNPNREMRLTRNPHYHPDYYPDTSTSHSNSQSKVSSNLHKQRLPFVDQFLFTLDKESIPRWHKFLQGYYDMSAVGSNNFDQSIQINPKGEPELSPALQRQHLQLQTSTEPAIFYDGFNMLDKVVGGYSERARKLRQAINIVMDYKEFIAIFLNGRGIEAQGPLPLGVFGYLKGKAGINPFVFDWINGKPHRKSLAKAKQLLAQAGYPNGRDIKTGKPLILSYDTTSLSSADSKARFDWLRKQFSKLGIQLNIRSTQFNRLQQKLRTGNFQIFSLGWIADYPDPENFLFLFYSPNSMLKHQGENVVNYHNPQFDRLFNQMKRLPNSPQRQHIVQKLLKILRRDSPWVWGYYPIDYTLSHRWCQKAQINGLVKNTAKYTKIDPFMRARFQKAWNQPQFGGILLMILGLLLLLIPGIISYFIKERRPRIQRMYYE